MSNWITVTIDNLKNSKVADLVDALRTSALGTGQTDRSTEIITNVILRIRQEVQACKTNIVDSDETKIPKELMPLAARFILWDLKNALEIPPTSQEERDHSDDLTYLRRIASCEVPISIADDPIATPTVQPASGTPRITDKTRYFDDAGECGL